jgi:hypothetical protein
VLPAAEHLELTASGLIVSGRALLRGYAITNDHATDASVITYVDGTASGAPERFRIDVAHGTSVVAFPTTGAVKFEGGLFMVASGGTPTVHTYYNAETRLLHELALFDDGTHDITEFALYRWLASLGGA